MNTDELQQAIAALDYTALGRAAWQAQVAILESQWRAWLASEYIAGTEVPAKAADPIFRKAWSDGHAAGYREVEYHYEELAHLIEEVLA